MLTELQTRKLLKLFCMYDGDRDGALQRKDFETIADKIATVKNLGSRSPRVLALKERFTQTWKSLLSKADESGDNKICLKEWLAYYSEVLEDKEKYAQEVQSTMRLIFEVFDANGDGKISPEEWAALFKVYNVHPAYAPSAFEQLDTDKDGVLSKDEVLALIDDFFCGSNMNSPANGMFGPY